MSALIGRVVEIFDTEKVYQDEDDFTAGPVHGVILDGWIVDSLEPRYLVGVLEYGKTTEKPVDGVTELHIGTLLAMGHRAFGMAPAPGDLKASVAKQATTDIRTHNGKRQVFRDGRWVDA